MARTFTFRLTAQGVAELQRDLDAIGEKGTAAFNRLKQSSPQLATGLDQAGQKVDQMRQRLERTGRAMGRGSEFGRGAQFGGQAIRQVGFQVQDMAIQLQAGQNAFMAFSQQGGQLAQALLGPQAALIATIGLIGAMIAQKTLFTSATEQAAEAEKSFKEALEASEAVLLTSTERSAQLAEARRQEAITASLKAIQQQRDLVREAREGTSLGQGLNLAQLRQSLELLQRAPENNRAQIEQLERQIERREIIIEKAQQEIGYQEYQLRLLQQFNALGETREDQAEQAEEHEKERAKFIEDIIKDLERQAEQDARRNVAVEKYIRGLESAAEFEQLSSTEKEVQRSLLEAQNRLIDEQGRKLRDLTEDEKARIRAGVEAREAREEARRAAEQAAKDFQREYEKAVDRGTEHVADFLFDAFEGKIDDIGELLERTLKRSVAEGLAQRVFNPLIVDPIVGAIMGGAPGSGGSNVAGLAAQAGQAAGVGGLVGGLGLADIGATVGGYLAGGLQFVKEGIFEASTFLDPTGALGVDLLGGGLTGGALGGLAAKLLGLGSGNMLVDTGLGLAGTVAGTMIGGPIGGAVGGFLGTAAGGLFGGGGFQNAPLTEGFTGIRNGRLVVTGVGTKGGDLGAAREWAQGGADFINALLESGGLSGISAAPRFDTKFGNFRTFVGPTPNNDATPAGGFLGVGGDAEQVLIDTVQNMVIRGFAAVDDPAVRTAIRNSASTTLEEFASDLDFAAALGSIDLNPEELTQAERALKAINEQFAEMTDRARQLGLSTEAVTRARDEALAELVEGFNDANRQAILQITDPLQAALDAFDTEAERRVREAEALGADLVLLERRNMLERQRIVDQYAGAGGLNDPLKELLVELTSGNSSGLAPEVVLGNAEARFNALRDAALSGDATARAQLPEAIRNLRAASEASFGGTPQYFERESFIVRTLETLTGSSAGSGGLAGSIQALTTQQAVDSAQMIDVLERMYKELQAVKAELKQREAYLARLAARVA